MSSATGYVPVTIFSECENGERVGLTFIDVTAPELDYPGPSIPPFPTIPAVPSVQGAGAPPCETTYFAIPRDQLSIFGTCTDQTGLLEYEWDFSLGGQ